MEYTYPSYFYDFQCEASACKDTCCAAWEIMIDPVSLKKYKKYPGSFWKQAEKLHQLETEIF